MKTFRQKREDDEMRDEIAFRAMRLFSVDLTDINNFHSWVKLGYDFVAKFCYDLADAMLEERRKRCWRT